MGTRNLTIVKKDKETKVAQYGQWDGYPTGQGTTIVEFLQNKNNILKLKENLKKVRFLDEEGKDREFFESYNRNAPQWSNEPDNRTEEQKRWFKLYITRDLGAEILFTIAESDDDVILLQNNESFKDDGIFCEYYYVIDLDRETVSMNGGKEYSFNEWVQDGFMEKLENQEEE